VNLEDDGGEVGEDVVVGGISEVILEVRDAADAGGLLLDDAAHRRHHREPAVGDLLDAKGLLLGGAGLGHAHGVEESRREEKYPTSVPVHLRELS